MGLLSTLSFIYQHPLNRSARVRALGRFARWQVASRLIGEPIALPYINDTRLFVAPGMQGATGNWYCGLHEHNDMGFVLHFLRSEDSLCDIGANVGSYTVLAAGACGARAFSFEPVPDTYAALVSNVRLNDLSSRVTTRNVAIGATPGTLRFTRDLDCRNRALRVDEPYRDAINVEVTTLDHVAKDASPTVCKIDVEGFEAAVIAGGSKALACQDLRSVIMEINGSGAAFGVTDDDIHASICKLGFRSVLYDATSRTLSAAPRGDWNHVGGNTIYVRDVQEARARIQSAKRFTLVNTTI